LGGEFFLDKNDFDKGNLKDELKNAGFEDCIADDIADRVDDRKTDNWTSDIGRTEALKEIDMLISRTRLAYDNFRNRNARTTTTLADTMESLAADRDII
jgi:hypothetical protein